MVGYLRHELYHHPVRQFLVGFLNTDHATPYINVLYQVNMSEQE